MTNLNVGQASRRRLACSVGEADDRTVCALAGQAGRLAGRLPYIAGSLLSAHSLFPPSPRAPLRPTLRTLQSGPTSLTTRTATSGWSSDQGTRYAAAEGLK